MTSKRTGVGRHGLGQMVMAVMVAFAAFVAAVGVSATASAHSGGKAIVLVRDFTITPVGDAWEARVHIVDLDSGTDIIAADMKTSVGAGPQAELQPVGEAQPGVYTGKLTNVNAGVADVRLIVRTAPGGEPLASFDRTYPGVTLTAGEPAVVTREVADKGGSNTGMIVGVVGAILLVALLYGLFAMRRRGGVPARAK